MRGCVTKKGNRYYAVLDIGRDANGRRVRKWHSGYPSRSDAEAALAKLVVSIGDGGYVAPNRRSIGDFLQHDWLPSIRSSVKPSTWHSYRRNLEVHVIPRIGNVALQKLTPAMLNTLYAELLDAGRADGKGGLSPKTVRNVHIIIRKALADAELWGHVARNVAAVARPPVVRNGATKHRTWRAEEVRAFLLSVNQDRLFAAWLLLATTGMRRGEVLGLRWQDVEFGTSRLSIQQTIVSVAYEVQVSSPKSAKSRRSLALDASSVTALRKHRAAQAEERLRAGSGYFDHGLVFSRQDGEPIHPDRFTQMFDKLVRHAEVPRIRLHDVRHTYATLAIESGVHAKVVSERLGHATVAFTLDVYAHAVPAMEETAAQKVADLFVP